MVYSISERNDTYQTTYLNTNQMENLNKMIIIT